MARRGRYAGLISIMLTICIIQLLFAPLSTTTAARSQSSSSDAQNKAVEITPQMMEGLAANVEVIEDQYGIPHIFAKKGPDAFFMQGFFHARDRFFQMDALRRTGEGTLAELLGQSALGQDVQLRALNLTRDAEAIIKLLRPETRKFIKSYVNGVNEYLSKNPLPPEYQALKITQKRMWTEMDTVLIGKLFAFSQSFDTSFSDITNTLALKAYQDAGRAKGFDGTALFFEDMYRSAPFDPSFTVPDAKGTPPASADPNIRVNDDDAKERLRQMRQWAKAVDKIKPETLELARKYVENFRGISTLLGGLVASQGRRNGSNWFVISGQHTESGSPMLTGDQHFDFATPPVWYQIQLNVAGKGKKALNVIGVSIPGAPGVVLGHNDNVAWVATVIVFDVTDVYQEKVELGFNTISIVRADGKKFPVERRLPTFRLNQITDGKTDNIVEAPQGSVPTLLPSVPFRNNGPIISLDAVSGTALSVQSAALGPTLEIEAIVEMNRAKSIKEFQDAIQYLDGAHVNMGVAAANGDIAYFATGEIPLREDLESGKVTGAPPFFIREGQGGNDWLPLRKKQFRQALPNEALPFEEMPQVINPKNGFIVNSNNDPAGTTATNNPVGTKRANGGIYYLSAGYDFGARASRLRVEIQSAIDARKAGAKKPIGIMDARRFQASVKMRDAEILLPFILKAFENAKRPNAPMQLSAIAADAGVSEALGRFSKWDFETPTGLRIGYDSFLPFNQNEPTDRQIESSVATTIYSLWRSQFLRDVVDATLGPLGVTPSSGYEGEIAVASLRNLLDNFAVRKGKGASGIQFFNAPELAGASAEDQRDFIILRSLRRSLDALASPDFAPAFRGSSNQRDYRWGLLHRGYFPHLFGMTSSFSIPAAGARYDSPIQGLFGIPRDGGYEVPNACSHNARAKGVNDFMFVHGPSQRFTVVMKPGAIEAVNALPGGQSGVLGNKFRDNLLDFWLVCDVYPFTSDKSRLMQQK